MTIRLPALLFVLPVMGALAAQETPPDGDMANPKTAQHELLRVFTGHWRVETEMAAMPGIPGMEQATTTVGTEEASLICDGLWLHVAGDGVCDGQACSGLWMVGFDPHAEAYQCIVASSMDNAPCCLEASFDSDTKTWHFRGETPMGPFRSELVFETEDRSVETCFAKGEDGEEVQFMRSVRTRIEGAADAAVDKAGNADESAGGDADAGELAPALAALHADCGTWDCDFEMAMPGAPAMTSECREVVKAICGGKWTWTTFTGQVMGMPFEGHALTGYDSKTDAVVSFWIDSMTAPFMRTDGTYDADKKAFTMSGQSYGETGQLVPVASTSTSTGPDSRKFRMAFGEGEMQSILTITYRRSEK